MSHAVIRKEIILDRRALSHYRFGVETWIIHKLEIQTYGQTDPQFEKKLEQGIGDGVLIIIDWLDAVMYGQEFYWLVQYIYLYGMRSFRIRIEGENPLDALRHLVDKYVEMKKMSRDVAERLVVELEKKGYFALPEGVSLGKKGPTVFSNTTTTRI